MLPPMTSDQTHAVNFALARTGCNLFARPGKGKTRIALECIKRRGGKTLVVAPLFPAVTTWPEENKKWGYHFDMRILRGKERKMGSEAVSVINYDATPWLMTQDLSVYDNVIFDEVHNLKNPGSKRFRHWRGPSKKFAFRLGLTGTPMGNTLKDLWGEMFMVDSGESLGRTLHGDRGFMSRFFTRHPYIDYLWEPRAGAHQKVMDLIKPRALSLDYYDEEMPELIHNVVSIKLPLAARKCYEEMQNASRIKDTDVVALNAGVRSMKLRQMAAGAVYDDNGDVVRLHNAKQRALKGLVAELKGDPIIVFTQFGHDITAIHEAVGNKAPVINGQTSTDALIRIAKEWNNGKIPVLIAHPRRAGVGANLQAGGRNVCFYTLPWSLGDIEQAIGRVWRQGQKRDQCIVTYLSCLHTKDETVTDAAALKKQHQNQLFNQLRSTSNENT